MNFRFMNEPFEPHQLDFDWRFDQESRALVAKYVNNQDRVLLLGCPSLMETLSKNVGGGHLFERNPSHLAIGGFGVTHCDLRFPETIPLLGEAFDLAILDAPWYPDDLISWLGTALSLIRIGGSVFFVLWPESTRPGAKDEHQHIFSMLGLRGEVNFLGNVSYEIPLFEKESLLEAGAPKVPRTGLLFRLTKSDSATLPNVHFSRQPIYWKRFQIFDEQVAVKVTEKAKSTSDVFQFDTKPLMLRSTSRRDPLLNSINIWTSKNMVARLANSAAIAEGIASGRSAYIDFVVQALRMNKGLGNAIRGTPWQHQI